MRHHNGPNEPPFRAIWLNWCYDNINSCPFHLYRRAAVPCPVNGTILKWILFVCFSAFSITFRLTFKIYDWRGEWSIRVLTKDFNSPIIQRTELSLRLLLYIQLGDLLSIAKRIGESKCPIINEVVAKPWMGLIPKHKLRKLLTQQQRGVLGNSLNLNFQKKLIQVDVGNDGWLPHHIF